MTNWLPLLMGWPALLFALALSGTGVILRKAWYLFTAAILILPISAYLAATPRFAFIALLAPLALVSGGLAVRRGKAGFALLMTLLVFVFYAWLALTVLRHESP